MLSGSVSTSPATNLSEELYDFETSSSVGTDSDKERGDSDAERDLQKQVHANPIGNNSTERRGMSKFYDGKSKSFTNLENAASAASIKEFAKPEYSLGGKLGNSSTRKCAGKPISAGKATVWCSGNSEVDYYPVVSSSSSSLPPRRRESGRQSAMPYLHSSQQNFSCRSFSSSDLHGQCKF